MKPETRAIISMFRNLGDWWDRQAEQGGAAIRGSQGRKDIAVQMRLHKEAMGRQEFLGILLGHYSDPLPLNPPASAEMTLKPTA